MEVLVDTSNSLEDVREVYVERLRNLIKRNEKLHAPPIVRFNWDGKVFDGVLENLGVSYLLFDPDGVPLRAKLSIVMKEYRPVAVQVRETRNQSADVDKTWTVVAGDTLDRIAYAVYRDASRWRVLADANGLSDPRVLTPGRRLDIPSYLVKTGDVIRIKNRKKSLHAVQSILAEANRQVPEFLSRIEGGIPEGRVSRLPESVDVSIPVQTQLIVELCSK